MKCHTIFCASALALVAGSSLATPGAHDPRDFEGADADGLNLFLVGSIMHTDNFYTQARTPTAIGGVSITPIFSLKDETHYSAIDLLGYGSFGFFSSVPADNFSDYGVRAAAEFKGASQSFLTTSGLALGHDPLGTQRTEGVDAQIAETDRWREPYAELTHRWGKPQESLLSTEVSARYSFLEYTNNKPDTLLQTRRTAAGSLKALVNFSAKTSVVAFISQETVRFPNDPNGDLARNGRILSVRGGVAWRATAKTTGEVQFGTKTRRLNDGTEQDSSDSWMAKVTWTPASTAQIEAQSHRSYEPSFRTDAAFIEIKRHDLEWKQEWSSRLSTVTHASVIERKFGRNATPDTKITAGLKLVYRVNERFHVFAKGQSSDYGGSNADADYTRSDIAVGFNTSFN